MAGRKKGPWTLGTVPGLTSPQRVNAAPLTSSPDSGLIGSCPVVPTVKYCLLSDLGAGSWAALNSDSELGLVHSAFLISGAHHST